MFTEQTYADQGNKVNLAVVPRESQQKQAEQQLTREQLILQSLKTKDGQEKLAQDWSKSSFPISKELAERITLTREWYKHIPPERVVIPAIGMDTVLLRADEIKTGNEDVNTLETPDNGIATPKQVIENNVVIFGHSRWDEEMQPMADIQNLTLNQQIFISAGVLSKVFVTTQYKIYDYDDPNFLLSGQTRQFLTLQTTASIGGEPILDPAIVLKKLTSTPNITSDHTALLVIAEPILP